MRKFTLTTVLLVTFFVIIALVICKYRYDRKNYESREYALLVRKGHESSSPEWISAKNQADVLIEALKTNPADKKSALLLAALFIKEARITGNHMYYDMAAMRYINHVLQQDSSDFNAVFYKAIV